MRTIAKALSILFVVGLASPVFAEDAKPFTDAKEINLLDLLPPPPANDSAQMKAELGEILTIQVTRTPEMAARAVADAEENVWRFSDAIDNPKFTKENLPKFSAFFDRIVETEGAVVDPAKNVWKRPRPHLYSDLVKPIVPLSKSGSYPSGHATLGTLMGIVLSNMVPEKRAVIMSRAWEYGHNRIVGGIHYASDIEAAHIAGTVIAETIMTHDDYKGEYEAAKAELRTALGL
ncbi:MULTISPECIES: phosphatase PAP2 family protein [unclassified Rhizobium]|uniref:acid phosphatase n=1 Tax=unclassified Rhizobium TaxID=2613769 RepID=UPI000DDCD645|nr:MULTISPECIES: phosphatase PAP2 family protein [unclassified Rhizobium]MBB3288235.1 acid phosphatase (class A) [Rhizobium sp. BK252]MBB3402901.1 acid phosphatase (class A) [Rhizobium sp. BK289]MBB3415478.1 acid phosphatase (class A) [Rhizobium sp. BK284]MBB3483441.1 acid phosphatase (class A) [Rhizobium sp. BK347]MDK4723465.1 phosphatase PAP2 family protein [Rhizobium sp. CNPSo 3968]